MTMQKETKITDLNQRNCPISPSEFRWKVHCSLCAGGCPVPVSFIVIRTDGKYIIVSWKVCMEKPETKTFLENLPIYPFFTSIKVN